MEIGVESGTDLRMTCQAHLLGPQSRESSPRTQAAGAIFVTRGV